MTPSNSVPVVAIPISRRSCLWSLFPTACLLCLLFFIWSAFGAHNKKEYLMRLGLEGSIQHPEFNKCKNQQRPLGSESLPRGIISKTSNLEMHPLWGPRKMNVNSSRNLFSVTAGIRQKEIVDKMIKKFISSDFVIMLFHYDGIVDEWRDLEWNNHAIHVSAVHQTKWWFAKRFLHPDIVAEYSYIFIWDEDLGVEDFHPTRYISIVKDEGLEISQPALDVAKSEVHHRITARGRRSNTHRRIYRTGDNASACDGNSSSPPCTGWIEVMAPVFSRAAWRCVWHMIQNDLDHAWGIDMKLGYCAQGDRVKNIGVVDSEYIVHYGIPTLGGSTGKEFLKPGTNSRAEVRRESYNEFKVFNRRWRRAAQRDKCWIDPYPYPANKSILKSL